MSATRIEDMTMSELAKRVKDTNGGEDRRIQAQRRNIVEDTTQRILNLLPKPPVPLTLPHVYSPGVRGCVRCAYAQTHSIHLRPATIVVEDVG